MTARRSGAVGPALASAAVAATALLLWAAVAGPPRLFTSGPAREPARQVPSTPTATASSDQPTLRELTRDVEPTADLGWLGEVIATGVLLGLVAAALWLVAAVWRHRWRAPEPLPQGGFSVLPPPALAHALAEDAGQRLAQVATGSPRNGIVRCWVALEEGVAAAGLPRERHETSTEYTVRVLHELDIDPAAVGTLAELYREARFSEHVLGEDARTAARRALERIHADLAHAGTRW